MTNRERLNALNNEDYELEMQMFANCTVRKYVDYQGWLDSDEEEYPIIGRDAIFQDTDRKVECKCVGETSMMQAPYATLIIKEPGLHVFKMIKTPMSNVTLV